MIEEALTSFTVCKEYRYIVNLRDYVTK